MKNGYEMWGELRSHSKVGPWQHETCMGLSELIDEAVGIIPWKMVKYCKYIDY